MTEAVWLASNNLCYDLRIHGNFTPKSLTALKTTIQNSSDLKKLGKKKGKNNVAEKIIYFVFVHTLMPEIIEYPELEVPHKDHRVQLLDP